MQQDPPLRADLNRNYKRWPSKRLMALRDRLLRMPDTGEDATEDPDPALVYSKADARWTRIHDAIASELDARQRGARKSAQGMAGQGKVRAPKR